MKKPLKKVVKEYILCHICNGENSACDKCDTWGREVVKETTYYYKQWEIKLYRVMLYNN